MEPAIPPAPLTEPLRFTCHCGGIRVAIAAKPGFVNECQCSVCYKLGAIWGYLERRMVDVTTADDATTLQAYIRSDENGDGDVSFNRCSHCGSLVTWTRVPGKPEDGGEKMGINCRMLEQKELEGLGRRRGTGPPWKVKKTV